MSRRRPALLLAAALAAAAGFALLAATVVLRPGALAGVDAFASGLVAPWRSPGLVAVFFWFTAIGAEAVFGMALVATGFLWVDRRAGLILPLWITYLGAQATASLVKDWIARPRPAFIAGLATAHSPSFPSAHATATAATVTFIAYAVARGLPGGWRHRAAAVLAAAALVGLIDLSRVVLGVHWATDVLGGILLGAAWLFVGLALAEWSPLAERLR